MKIRCRLEFEMGNEQSAQSIADSVKVDDDGFVNTVVSGRTIRAEIEADTVASLMHTVEDYMACLSIAEKSLNQDPV